MKKCLSCNKELKNQTNIYCSNLCQSNFRYQEYISLWKSGLVSGSRGKLARGISEHVRRYLEDKYSNKCSLCGWNEKHPITGHIPLEVDHINGSSEDNREDNLRLICPNCHSLSSNYRNLNKGRGRSWRTKKYLKNAKP